MKITLKVTRYTTDSELIHLGNFFTALGINRGGKVFAAPTDPAELDEPEVTHVAVSPEQEAEINILTGKPEPKRRRRTKAEIEAEAEATRIAEAEAEAQRSNEAGLKAIEEQEQGAIAPGEPGNEQPASTPPATEPVKTEPAAESPSERQVPTHATLNMKATAVAKKIGPDKIKAKIGELGGKLISTLSPEALVEFDTWLDAQ